ncbi:MAG TPA: lasso RiPP family leader peptide-containing protein [Candidatus Solibacter sp.]|nr:lasso RiPP family leader peptide-containing protein [Candidatus Solibacter sp.]
MNEEILNQKRKEVRRMQKKYEAPELTVIGDAQDVVMGSPGDTSEVGFQFTPDFEFEQD